MHDREPQAHVGWGRKYHVVFVPKYRRKALSGNVRRRVGRIIRGLCRQKGVELIEGHAKPDHIRLCLAIPPRHGVAHPIGFIKGKSAVRIHRELLRGRRLVGLHFWAVGYCVSTVDLDEEAVRQYIREQGEMDGGQGHLKFE